MGNNLNQNQDLRLCASSQPLSKSQIQLSKDKFIIKQIIAHSPEHYQELLTQLSNFKQYQTPHILKVVDFHTMQAHHLCSIITHMYVVLQKPAHNLKSYIQELNQKKTLFCNKKIMSLLVGCLNALIYLKKEGIEVTRIKQEDIFIDVNQHGEITTKIINPYFVQTYYESQQECVIQSLGAILKQMVKFQFHSSEIIQVIDRMAKGSISLQDLEQKYLSNSKRNKRLKLSKDVCRRAQRQSIATVVSNGSSLLIDAGDESQLILKQFYQNFENQISEISVDMDNDSIYLDVSHQFPKKYAKSKAFRKTQKLLASNWSEMDQKQNITRDQSLKQNVRIESRHILLQSAKLVESFIDPQ